MVTTTLSTPSPLTIFPLVILQQLYSSLLLTISWRLNITYNQSKNQYYHHNNSNETRTYLTTLTQTSTLTISLLLTCNHQFKFHLDLYPPQAKYKDLLKIPPLLIQQKKYRFQPLLLFYFNILLSRYLYFNFIPTTFNFTSAHISIIKNVTCKLFDSPL